MDRGGHLQADPGECGTPGSFHLVEPRTDTGIYIGSSWLEYRDLADRLQTMTDLLAFRMAPLYVGDSGKVERGNGLLVSGNYFSGLGLTPALGRLLRPEDVDHQVGQPVMVISYDYWRTRLGGSADVIGQSMRVNGQTLTIVGVAPEGFQGNDPETDLRYLAAGAVVTVALHRVA